MTYNTKIGEFCATHSNWEELLAQEPYHIIIKRKDGFVIFNYRQLESDFNNEIVRECRGIIFKEGEWEYPVCHAFDKFGNLGESYVPDMDWSTVKVSEKIDGCFSRHDCVMLSDGTKKPISEIVNKKLKCEVLSYNFSTNKIEPKKVIGWKRGIETFNERDWLTLSLRGVRQSLCGKKSQHSVLTVTHNHQIFVKHGDCITEKSAGDLTTADIVLTPVQALTTVEEQLVYGGLLGDGWLTYAKDAYASSGYMFSHSLKQVEYAKYKAELLRGLVPTERVRTDCNSFGGTRISECTKVNPALSEAKSICYKNGKKLVTSEWLNKLNWLGFAVWYMDDGYRNQSAKNNSIGLATEGFSLSEVECIRDHYLSLGYKSNITEYRGYYKLTFSTEASERIWTNIRCYIPECMQYKLPERHRGFFNTNWSDEYGSESCIKLVEAYITEIKPGFHRKGLQGTKKYDIEVEDNHNYFCGGIMVHNSIMKLWCYDNKWHVSTNGNIDAKDAPVPDIRKNNFEELFWEGVRKNISIDNTVCPYSIPGWLRSLNPERTYIFEMVSPYTRVVIPYEETNVFFLGARHNELNIQYGCDEHSAYAMNTQMFPRPKIYSMNSLEDIINAANELPWDEEGYVCYDKDFNRCKIKSPKYVMAHFARNNNVITRWHLIDIILKGEMDEFIIYASDYKDQIECVKKLMDEFIVFVDDCALMTRNLRKLDRPEAAEVIKKFNKFVQPIMFMNLDRIVGGRSYTYNWDTYRWERALDNFTKFLERGPENDL